jgi:hypothetical protein
MTMGATTVRVIHHQRRHAAGDLQGNRVKIARRTFPLCHGRTWPGHPRLAVLKQEKSWVAGTRPAMTQGKMCADRPFPVHPIALWGPRATLPLRTETVQTAIQ